ncbi:MAG: hypothetical protein A2W19_15965 [Spirochaetes bacterium RBG_16_49_21]|nr:MAG: hypothetical protein A2W19_15965 [Spirochaetes bacterium RBG_16_49_21]
MSGKIFIDTNLWVYLFSDSESSDDMKKNASVKHLLRESPDIIVSAQVLSELSNVLLKKMNFPVDKIRNIIYEMTESIEIKPVDERDISYALDIVERYKISWFDALIAASAINSKTDTLYSEDLQHGLEIDRSIKIINPFV